PRARAPRGAAVPRRDDPRKPPVPPRRMTAPEKRIYLASRSPRRRELLKQIGIPFEVLLLRDHPGRNVDVDESALPGESPADYVLRVSCLKSQAGWERVLQRKLRRFPVLAADTVVTVDKE